MDNCSLIVSYMQTRMALGRIAPASGKDAHAVIRPLTKAEGERADLEEAGVRFDFLAIDAETREPQVAIQALLHDAEAQLLWQCKVSQLCAACGRS